MATPTEEIDLAEMFHSKRGVYVLRVRGDSMIDDHLIDGDFVVMERSDKARNGNTVVALLHDGQATIRRYYRDGDSIRLQPANSKIQPRIVDASKVTVQGVVIGVIRHIQQGES